MMPARTSDTDLEQIARALGGKRIASGGWSCRCPAHEDRHNSLSLTVKEGRLLWRCHAGCDQAQVQAALENEKLIERRQASGERPQPTGRALRSIPGGKPERPRESLGRIVATYDYLDVTGDLLFQVVRFEPKTFRQRRPKAGGWEWGLGRVQPVLYRLPEVLAAETVFVVEGEKDVERLRSLGLVATSSPMGAGKWRPEYGESLSGKHVVVLPDNDDAGRAHAEDVATSAQAGGARSVRVVELPKLPEKGDLSNWLDAGGTRDQLEGLVRETRRWGGQGAGDPGWRSRLIQGDQGPIGNEANCELALSWAPELVGRMRYDAFRSVEQARDLPWSASPDWRDWTDHDDTELAMWCQRAGINIPPIRALAVAATVARRAEFHPVRDYLRGIKWDEQPRIDDWLNTYLGVAYTSERHRSYVQAVGSKWLISAVARVMDVPCKVDTALILEGDQGAGKSTAAAVLAGQDWFTDQISDLGTKDSSQDLPGKWIIELAELSAMGRPEVERVKAFMSRQVDHYRPSYARRSVDAPRQCVFIGSTNRDDFLKDETGNRRFWPVRCGPIDLKALKRDRDQLWAEAFRRHQAGEPWHLTREIAEIAHEEQADRVQVDPWRDMILDWTMRQTVGEHAIHEVLRGALEMKNADMGQREMNRVAAVLRLEGWRRVKKRVGKSSTWVYRRPG